MRGCIESELAPSEEDIQAAITGAKVKLKNARNNFRKSLKAKWLHAKELENPKQRKKEAMDAFRERMAQWKGQVRELNIPDIMKDEDFIQVFRESFGNTQTHSVHVVNREGRDDRVP